MGMNTHQDSSNPLCRSHIMQYMSTTVALRYIPGSKITKILCTVGLKSEKGEDVSYNASIFHYFNPQCIKSWTFCYLEYIPY